MKKAVIICGGVQHLVAEGDEIIVNSLGEEKTVEFTPVMIVDGDNSLLDAAKLKAAKVTADVLENMQGDKVVALRYKAKKRVQTRRGHRQALSRIKITAIK